jgi:sulfite reductase (ferredoxin)
VAIKKFFDKNGNRKNKRQARLRFLRDKFGDQGLVEKLLEAVEQERAAGWTPLEPAARPAWEPAANAVETAPGPGFEDWKNRHATPAKREGFFNVRVPVLLGDIPAERAEALGRALESFGADSIRLAIRQNILLSGIPSARLPELHGILKVAGLADDPGLVGSIVACTGADTCKLGMCLPKGATRELARRLPSSGLDLPALEGLRIHVSGCPNTCAQHMIADLGFYGIARRQSDHSYPAYRVVVGGVIEEGNARLAREITQVSAWKMPDFVVEALRAFQETREGRTFAQWLDAGGEAKLVALAAPFAAVPDWSENQAPYVDWSATEPFSPAKGGAECSAGLFDLIEVDRKAIERAKEVLDESPDDVRALYATLLSTARMLLITRSLEPVGDRAVFDAFATEFVKTGLVPARFSSLLLRARELGVVGASGRSAEVLELAGIVEALYQGMDDSLRFPELAATA